MPERTGRAKGGVAAAANMTEEKRKERAMKGVEARKEAAALPIATHRGSLIIGDTVIPCAVLEGGKRVISENGITNALLGSRSGASKRLKKAAQEAGAPMPLFLAPPMLKPFIDKAFGDGHLKPLRYYDKGKIVHGYDATILPAVCEVWLSARDAGVLQDQQQDKAAKAELLIRGLAHVGIIALVDEATGYQDVRARDELNLILQAYIAKELLPWTKRFPDEFYKQIFRLHNWDFNPMSVKRPGYVGTLTNKLVYERLPEGVLDELKKVNPPNESGNRKHRHHQFLTESIGNPHLEKHIASVTTLMRVSDCWRSFTQIFLKAFPLSGDQQPLFAEEDHANDDDN
jgi:hypothetical protein